jgi:hypothetical protein
MRELGYLSAKSRSTAGFCQINANGSHPHGERSFSLGGETTPNVGTLLPI